MLILVTLLFRLLPRANLTVVLPPAHRRRPLIRTRGRVVPKMCSYCHRSLMDTVYIGDKSISNYGRGLFTMD